jgi:hypothetical protein
MCTPRSQEEGYALVRCGTPEAAQVLLAKCGADQSIEFGEGESKVKYKFELLAGDDEKAFWDRRAQQQEGFKRQRDDDDFGSNKRGRGGRGRGRGRGRGGPFRGRRGR